MLPREAGDIAQSISMVARMFRRYGLPCSPQCEVVLAHYKRVSRLRGRTKTAMTLAQRLRRHIARHPDRYRARRAFTQAVLSGLIVRPDACSVCATACKPHGHHDDYAKPYDVRWLCAGCHYRHHTSERRALRKAS